MKPFKKEKSMAERNRERKKLINIFINKYGKPVIVHAMQDKKIFKKVLEEGELKLPKKHDSAKKCPHMEKLLGIDNAIYYSLGFVYNTAYGWKYNIIFDLNYLKDLTYYYNSVNYVCYLAIVKYLAEEDMDSLMKLRNKNKKSKEVVDKFLNETYSGKKRRMFDFWKIEKETFDHIRKYKDKRKLIKIIRDTERKYLKKYPKSKKYSIRSIADRRIPEIIGKKKNNLLKNPHFLGFYIDGKIPPDILTVLKKKYPNKIIFDGKRINKIGEVLK